MNDLKEYLKTVLVEKGISVDVSDGSPLADLLVSPAAAMLAPTMEQLDYLWQVLGINKPELMDAVELDVLAGNFLIYRNKGAYATGTVDLLYEAPQELIIPAGTEFYGSNNTVFVTERTYQIPKESMRLTAYPYYVARLIPVVAKTPGISHNIAPFTITSTNLSTSSPASVRNTSEITGGGDAESNRAFVERLYVSVRSRSLASNKGIETALKENFESISSVVVKGYNDSEVIRDLIVESGLQNVYGTTYHLEDFYGKISGMNEYPYPESRAFYTYFFDNPTTSGIQPDLPDVDQFFLEFSPPDYAGMYYLNDALCAILTNKKLVNANFDTLTTLGPEWIQLDASQQFTWEEIQPVNGKVRLGKRHTTEELLNTNLYISAKTLSEIRNFLLQLRRVNLPHGERATQEESAA